MHPYNQIISPAQIKLSCNHVNRNKLDKFMNAVFQNDNLLEGIV